MRELRIIRCVSSIEVETVINIADMMAKCLSATVPSVRERPVFELSAIARKHLGGT